ncbi:hypothetical protein GCM10009098_15320 [Rheinheimera aquimaris]|uniref:Small integral membrane protein n=1 Tax=Rheinheimera aquimaris TaxID=412437 RepID=A0ABN1DR92_9GAMM|nr:hypothetical protein [Rheinheimera aquimaris]
MSDELWHRKEEYLSLRKEIENSLSDLSTLEKNSLLGIAAVYSWLASQECLLPFFAYVAAGVPFFISIFGALRAYSVNKHLGIIGAYINRIEVVTHPGDAEYAGWEHFFKSKGGGIQTKMRMYFWAFLAFANFAIWIASWYRE